MQIERRCIHVKSLEVRALAGDDSMPTLVGYAAVYDTPTDLGGFIEEIERGAFGESISRGDDVRALFNHDTGHVLGRRDAGTLRIRDDAKGVHVEIDLPNTSTARDLSESIARGDINQMSVSWYLDDDFESEWIWQEGRENDEKDLRRIKRAALREVSIVAIPAYDDTTIAKRAYAEARTQKFSGDSRHSEKNTTTPPLSREVLMARHKLNLKKKNR